MLLFYITGLAFLVGGEINSTMEHAAAEHGHPEAKAEGQKAPASAAEVKAPETGRYQHSACDETKAIKEKEISFDTKMVPKGAVRG
jgi:hypothetical protein